MERQDVEFGEYLRKTRESLNIPLEDICKRLKVNSRYIKAVEDGSIYKIVEKVYAHAYIKSYCNILNINVPEFIHQNIQHSTTQNTQFVSPAFISAESLQQSRNIAISLAAALIAVYVALFVYHKNKHTEQIREHIVKSALVSLREVESIKISPVAENNNKIFKDLFGSNSSTVLIASEKTSLRIYDPSSKLLTSKTLDAGDTLFLNKEEGLIITADNDNGVEVFDENDLKPLNDFYTHKLKDKFYIKSARYIPVSKD